MPTQERHGAIMKGTFVHTAAALLAVAGLLVACGPGNTLRTKDGSDDFRLKAVESSLEKIEQELKDLKNRQGRDDAALGQVQKHMGEVVAALKAKGMAPTLSAAPQGSALGVGFAHPGAAAAAEPAPQQTPAGPQTGPSQSVAPQVSPQAAGQVAPPSAAPEASQGIPMPVPENGRLATGRQPSAAMPPSAKGRRNLGHVGPAEPPATPEAAIAADRAGQPAAPTSPPAAASTTASKPASPAGAEPQPAAASPGAAEEPAAKAVPGTDNRPGGLAETASPAEKAEYNRALQLAINGNAAGAKAAFEQFAAAHAASPLAPSALYWVGESAYAAGDYKTAVTDFDKVAKGWPGHGKAADALYKMAMAQEKTGDTAAARATLERYLKDYPQAELASVVRQKLQTMPK